MTLYNNIYYTWKFDLFIVLDPKEGLHRRVAGHIWDKNDKKSLIVLSLYIVYVFVLPFKWHCTILYNNIYYTWKFDLFIVLDSEERLPKIDVTHSPLCIAKGLYLLNQQIIEMQRLWFTHYYLENSKSFLFEQIAFHCVMNKHSNLT